MRQLTAPGRRLVGGGDLRAPVAGGATRAPSRWRRIAAWLLVGAMLAAVAIVAHHVTRPPHDLGEIVLVGDPTPAPTNLVVVMDVSGSMSAYESSRARALADIVSWGQRNMRPTDTIAVYVFDSGAQQILPPTPISRLGSGLTLDTIALNNGGTEIEAVARLMGRGLGSKPHTMVWITDTQISVPAADEVRANLARANVVSSTTIVPPEQGVTAEWMQVISYGSTQTASPDNSDEIGVAIARAVADSTGQRVERTG